jgi:hypothetical protein
MITRQVRKMLLRAKSRLACKDVLTETERRRLRRLDAKLNGPLPDPLSPAQQERMKIMAQQALLKYHTSSTPCCAWHITWGGLGSQCLNCGATAKHAWEIKHLPSKSEYEKQKRS